MARNTSPSGSESYAMTVRLDKQSKYNLQAISALSGASENSLLSKALSFYVSSQQYFEDFDISTDDINEYRSAIDKLSQPTKKKAK